jgi:hypothetical protein
MSAQVKLSVHRRLNHDVQIEKFLITSQHLPGEFPSKLPSMIIIAKVGCEFNQYLVTDL